MADIAADKVKVVENFLPSEDLEFVIKYINDMAETHPENFVKVEATGRLLLTFGDEQEEDSGYEEQSLTSLELLGDSSELVKGHMTKVLETVKDLYNDDEKLYITSLWFSKQGPGSVILGHEDASENKNTHFKYSVILYLNESADTPELEFPDLGYKYKPAAGDLVMFPSIGLGEHRVGPANYDRYAMIVWLTADKSLSIYG